MNATPEPDDGLRPEFLTGLSPARRRLLELRLRGRAPDGGEPRDPVPTGSPPWRSLVAMRPAGTRPPLFCMHDSTGQVWAYRDLPDRVDPAWPIYGIQVPGAAPAGWRTLADLVETYVREIQELNPEGPYFFLGSCSGGVIAYAVACELRARGKRVGLIVLVDPTSASPALWKNYQTWPRRLFNFALVESPGHLKNMLSLSGHERRAYVALRVRRWLARIRRRSTAPATDGSNSEDVLERTVLDALRSFSAEPFPGRVVLFQSRRFVLGTHPQLSRGWDQVPIGELVVHRLEGFSGFAIKEPRLRRWVHVLNAELGRAADAAGSGPSK